LPQRRAACNIERTVIVEREQLKHAATKRDNMSRTAAIARAHTYFDSGEFLVDLRRRVAIPSTSQEPERAPALRRYLEDEMVPSLAPLGFTSRILDNPSGPPFLVAERMEEDTAFTVLIYGHGDTVRGLDDLWRAGLSPWVLTVEGERLYGRGTADNKGQHSVNIAALAAVLAERGRLGFNTKILIEMGEEVGSAGLHELCVGHKHDLLRADLLIASDGPRAAPDRPTLFLGARGSHPIELVVDLREAAIIPATGAVSSPIRASFSRMRLHASPMPAARSACRNGARRCRRRCGACSPASRSEAAETVRPSIATGAKWSSRRPSASSAGTALRCWRIFPGEPA
jgi:hypothetical protein